MVSPLALAAMAAVLVLCVVVPLSAFAWIATRRNAEGGRRWRGVWRAFWAGALAFTVSQLLTRIPLMTVVIPTLGPDVSGFLLSAPVASYSAGLFEETGRLVIMLLLMKAFHRWIDGVTFGFGHGGIEAVLLVGMTMLNNLLIALIINAGQWETVAAALPEAAATQVFNALTTTDAAIFLLGGVERLSAISLHVACSVLILAGIVHGRKMTTWLVAVLLHGSFNMVAILGVSGGWPILVVEIMLAAIAVALWFGIAKARAWFTQPDAFAPAQK
ncbi:MAG: YhfC family glutamic-type intramembrane protease [Propioniciclava sp.]|uniref:YhfC family intramembrane metalloprotease n=1 Tax=Propioniciclava sp. TaxID=2038686 RepID=UPI0039E5D32E